MIDLDTVEQFARRALTAIGFSDEDAAWIGDHATRTEAMGVTTHGLYQVLHLDKAIDRDAIDPTAAATIAQDHGSAIRIDQPELAGQLALRAAMQLAAERVGHHGIFFAALGNSHWVGGLGTWLIDLADRGYLARLEAQNCAVQDSPPHGSYDARFSTNPIGLAIPTDGDPIVADFCTSTIAMGRVRQLISRDEKADVPRFFNKEGQLTDDPTVVKDGGCMELLGGKRDGHKGYALTLWNEAMAALAGGWTNHPDHPSRQNLTLTVIDPESFAGADHFRSEMRSLIDQIHAARPLPNVDRIRLPGEGAYERWRQAQAEGIDLSDKRQKLDDLAERLKIPPLSD
ncbi:MAG: Ldh family oxidoreductase [Phycisphaeraceae bacterium]|nr:Ldh family oxidoreductase [Phycisphaeraceae bacterium]